MEKELSELEHGISELKKEISKLMTKPLTIVTGKHR